MGAHGDASVRRFSVLWQQLVALESDYGSDGCEHVGHRIQRRALDGELTNDRGIECLVTFGASER
jgi:hypothetical protein